MSVLEKIVYLTKEQFESLRTTGEVAVAGKTIEYNENDVYVVPDGEEYNIYMDNDGYLHIDTKQGVG